eukprot:gene11914-15015_t
MRTLRGQTKARDRRSSVSSNDKNLKAMGLGSGATPAVKARILSWKGRLEGLKREKARQEAMRTLRVQTMARDRRSSVSSNDKNLKAMGLGMGATPGSKSKKF